MAATIPVKRSPNYQRQLYRLYETYLGESDILALVHCVASFKRTSLTEDERYDLLARMELPAYVGSLSDLPLSIRLTREQSEKGLNWLRRSEMRCIVAQLFPAHFELFDKLTHDPLAYFTFSGIKGQKNEYGHLYCYRPVYTLHSTAGSMTYTATPCRDLIYIGPRGGRRPSPIDVLAWRYA